MKTIVLAYNETLDSDRALLRTAELATFYGAGVVVTSVVPVLVGSVTLGAPGPELQAAGERLREVGIEPQLVEAVGDIAEAIVEVAISVDADLIVVGTREPSQVERLLGYSVSDDVQRRAHCDVLIVHP